MSDERDHHAPAIRTLRLAAESCGGIQALAACLAVEETALKAWMEGAVRTPNDMFLKALDIVASGPYADPASRAQARADRMQAAADRVQASADRMQSAADRAQEIANRARQGGAAEADQALKRIAENSKKKTTS